MKLLIFIILLINFYSIESFRLLSNNKHFKSSYNKDVIKLNDNTVLCPVFDEVCDNTGITLTRYMVETVIANPQLREMESLILAIQTACKTISREVERASITGITGLEAGGGSVNVQGEEQKRLDVITNDIMKKALRFSGKVGTLASEEEDAPVGIDGEVAKKSDRYKGMRGDSKLKTTQFDSDVLVEELGGKYVAVFDPLDGSSNVDAGIPTGTIFGIFTEDPDAVCSLDDDSDGVNCLLNTLQPGTSLVASGYCLYSSSTFLCLTLGNGVNIFTLDRSIGEFVLTHQNVKIPKRGAIYSFNEANRLEWEKPLQKYIHDLQQGTNESKKTYSARYIGSMVGDVHRTLLYGGIFGYPATTKNPNGKLRLLYEAAPMSFLIEQASGKSTTGKTRIMEIKPEKVHQRVPCMLGSPDDIDEMLKYYASK